MRITRQALLKLARDRAALLARQDRSLICIYLTGSLLFDAPLLGGTTDIDLICVHSEKTPQPRLVTRISNEVHFDEAHYSQTIFLQPRRLRLNPWVGSYLIHNPLPLYDVQHWFEFTQASVSDKFNDPEMVIQRLTADGYKDIFLGPSWAVNKMDALNSIDWELKRRRSWQGSRRDSL